MHMDSPIYSLLSLNTSMGVRVTCVQEGLGVAGTWLRVIEQALTGLNNHQGN
ncbi:hypothetical protein BDV33DRAFT_183552 [Aspergillus novoparasiticus]|uniref:Uncharacterized protein n=1 Tax=Aspergillus novoparasiticus TaxID=986946 RepID=A0A5N6EB36_9EURO|nr:hypothetical protein BDV33DRAFT_183552 [Aspergillus novoparasiticus]